MTFTMLQATRFIAALLVVLYHCDKIFAQAKYYNYMPFGGLFDGGGLGVDYFFVLSGFVILTAHHRHIGQPQELRRYLVSRAARIYPLYWIVAIAVLTPLYFVGTSFEGLIYHPLYLLKEFLLLPSDDNFVTVSWTLRHEVLFYTLFAALLCHREFGLWLLACWFLASATFAPGRHSEVWILVDPRNLQFLLGMAAAFVVRTQRIGAPRSLLLLGTGGFAACYLYGGLIHGDLVMPGSPNVIITVGLAAAFIICALVELERSHGWSAPKPLRTLGEASYAIYLVHMPLFTPFVWLTRAVHLERVLPLPVLVALMAASGVLGGVLVYQFVDRPLRGVVRRWLGFGKVGASPAPAALLEGRS